jgi:hypothetical protein
MIENRRETEIKKGPTKCEQIKYQIRFTLQAVEFRGVRQKSVAIALILGLWGRRNWIKRTSFSPTHYKREEGMRVESRYHFRFASFSSDHVLQSSTFLATFYNRLHRSLQFLRNWQSLIWKENILIFTEPKGSFEVNRAVTVKTTVFSDVTPYVMVPFTTLRRNLLDSSSWQISFLSRVPVPVTPSLPKQANHFHVHNTHLQFTAVSVHICFPSHILSSGSL